MTKHLGSTAALILGLLSFAGSVSNPSYTGGLIAGPVIILGALAFRSAKKRRHGEVPNTALRKGLEALALILIAAAILLQNNLAHQIATDPVVNVVIPLWAIIAYTVVTVRGKQASEVGKV